MNATILSPNAYAQNTTSSTYPIYKGNTPAAESYDYAINMLIITTDAGRRSPRNGKLPRGANTARREQIDPEFRHRMEIARAALAEELGELLPDSLAKLRLQRGMSQHQLAQALRTSQSHIAKIEAGSVNIQWLTAIHIADALAVSLDQLRPLIKIKQDSQKTTMSAL